MHMRLTFTSVFVLAGFLCALFLASSATAQSEGYYICKDAEGRRVHGLQEPIPKGYTDCDFVKFSTGEDRPDGYCDPVEPCWEERKKMTLSTFTRGCIKGDRINPDEVYGFRLSECQCIEKELSRIDRNISTRQFSYRLVMDTIERDRKIIPQLYMCQKND